MEALSSTPMHRLPPEVLIRIFGMVYAEWDMADHDANYEGAPDHMEVSHVCQRWRKAALDTQELWSRWPRYETVDDGWTLLCCSRATTAPLYLNWKVGWTGDDDDAEEFYHSRIRHILPYAARAQYLSIDVGIDYGSDERMGPKTFWHAEVLPALSTPFSLLQVFRIEMEFDDFNDDFTLCLDKTLFDGHSPPALRSVFLSCCEAKSNTPLFSSNLSKLEIHHARAWTNVDDMIRVFQSIPNLESLIYRFDYESSSRHLYDATPSQHYPLRAVPMNRLKSFTLIDCRIVAGITVFCYLALPFDTDIHIQCTYDVMADMSEDELTQAYRCMRMGADALQQHFASALRSGYDPYAAVEIDDSSVSPISFMDDASNGGRPLPRTLCWYTPFAPMRGLSQHSREILAQSEPCVLIALQPVFLQATYLHLNGSYADKWNTLWAKLHLYDKVAELHLSYKTVRYFATYLDSREYRVERLPALFPFLEIMTLSHFNFRGAKTIDDEGRALVDVLGAAVCRTYGTSESFQRIYVGASCKGQRDTIERLRVHLGEQRVAGDSKV
ncbi:hypothetical protein PENSPDRAFT_752665 [Peniophora sp. CONT]|nr:hypothetical protein PENSPDRAFT_752665 [Peniophora sp. CONT]